MLLCIVILTVTSFSCFFFFFYLKRAPVHAPTRANLEIVPVSNGFKLKWAKHLLTWI